MAKKPEGDDFDLDKLAGRFRRVSAYATAQAGYAMLFILITWAALILAIPAAVTAIALGVDAGISIGAALASAAFAFMFGWLMYWAVAETLRLNRVMAASLAYGAIIFVVLFLLMLVVGVGHLVMGGLNLAGPTQFSDGSPPQSVYYFTAGVVFLVSAAASFNFMRLMWSYVTAAFARPAHRRMLKPLNHTDAKLIGGQRVIFGGGVSIPTLKKGATTVRAFNVGRCVFAGLAGFAVLSGLTYLAEVLRVAQVNDAGEILASDTVIYALPFMVAAFVAAVFVGAAFFAYLARVCLRAARRRARFGLDAIRDEDKRAPTLFLRPFHDDQVELTRNRGKRTMFAVEPAKRELDHILVEEFSWSGPVVAIGRPGEKELPFGAARTFLSNDVWQVEAIELASASGEIVMVVDDTPGVQWEIDQVSGRALRDKTLFLMHPRFADPVANRRMVESICKDLGMTAPAEGKPVLALWLREGQMRVLRAEEFSVETYTLALRDFFRSRAEAAEALEKAERRARKGRSAPVEVTAGAAA